MFSFMRKFAVILGLGGALFATASPSFGWFWKKDEEKKEVKEEVQKAVQNSLKACPDPATVEQKLSNLFKDMKIKVLKVEENPYLNQFCDVALEISGEKFLLYVDREGRYVLIGSRSGMVYIVDLNSGENLTAKKLEELNRLSKDEVHELDKYVAFTYGDKGKVIYLFTDPECPFCQKIEPTLKKLADEGKVQVKVILFPLPFHEHAKEKSIAMVCQNIGWEGLRADYWTEERMKQLPQWQCEEGKKLVEQSLQIAAKYKVTGTPTIITEDGKKVVGYMPEEVLVKELGVEEGE